MTDSLKESNLEKYQCIFPHFFRVIERICTPSWHIKQELYKWHNFILIYDGRASFEVNGEKYDAGKGDLMYFKPGDLRTATTYPENLMKCFAVDFAYTCPVHIDGQWSLRDIALPFDTYEKIKDAFLFSRLISIFEDLDRTWISGRQNSLAQCRNLFMEMLNLMLMWKSEENPNYHMLRKADTAIKYMTENYHRKISLTELAEEVGLSIPYFGKTFKEITGKTPINYLIDIRIKRAKELLNEGMNVSQAAILTGFSDVYYFSRCFKKCEGITPSGYMNTKA